VSLNVVEALVKSGLCMSRSDARRQIQQGQVKVGEDGKVKLTDIAQMLDESTLTVWVGKRKVTLSLGE